ncbi:MAG: hypothetical protein HYZ92_02490 [Candidatus Omnitrophica bacterium]|nr:hypothetical protein [Candidatus Omnitrophota bacterium]
MKGRGVVATCMLVVSAVLGMSNGLRAEDQRESNHPMMPVRRMWPGRAFMGMPPPNSPQQIEATISTLQGTADQSQVGQLRAGLAQLQDPAERKRLEQLLDQRLQGLTPMSETPPMPTDAIHPGGLSHQDMSPPFPPPEMAQNDEALLAQVETVTVGPSATVEDLRVVDRLVQAIARLTDPVRREALLNRLQQRERDAEAALRASDGVPMSAPFPDAGQPGSEVPLAPVEQPNSPAMPVSPADPGAPDSRP